MKNAFGWLRFLPRWAWAAAAIGLVAALTPAVALAQAGPSVINSFNGSGLTLRAYINGILKKNNLADGVASAPQLRPSRKYTAASLSTMARTSRSDGPKW